MAGRNAGLISVRDARTMCIGGKQSGKNQAADVSRKDVL